MDTRSSDRCRTVGQGKKIMINPISKQQTLLIMFTEQEIFCPFEGMA